MENTSLIALSREAALQRQMDVVANNIANMNTTGYKGQQMMFAEQLVSSRGGDRTSTEQLAFVRDVATRRDTTEGPLQKTDNALDVAVRGNAYFVVSTQDGDRYTRNGNFRLDQTGQLVTQDGDAVETSSGAPLTFSATDREITIARDGSVSTENGQLGKLKVVSFDNEQSLQATVGGLYASDARATDVDRPDVVQGMLEGSNIEPVREMANMIQVHRAYDDVKNLLDRENERMQRAIRDLGNAPQ